MLCASRTSCQRFVVIGQFGNHIQRFDVLRVVIELAPRLGQSERKSCSAYQDSSGSRGGVNRTLVCQAKSYPCRSMLSLWSLKRCLTVHRFGELSGCTKQLCGQLPRPLSTAVHRLARMHMSTGNESRSCNRAGAPDLRSAAGKGSKPHRGGAAALQRRREACYLFGVIFAVKDCATIFPLFMCCAATLGGRGERNGGFGGEVQEGEGFLQIKADMSVRVTQVADGNILADLKIQVAAPGSDNEGAVDSGRPDDFVFD